MRRRKKNPLISLVYVLSLLVLLPANGQACVELPLSAATHSRQHDRDLKAEASRPELPMARSFRRSDPPA